jgi:hypothetical protein
MSVDMFADNPGGQALFAQYQARAEAEIVAAERMPPPLVVPEPSDFAVFTAGWLIGLAVRESPAGIQHVEQVEGSPASVRITSITGRKLLVTVTEEA